MIYTVTLNPSLDYNIKLSEFKEGRLNTIVSQYKTAGGKGINVSQVLRNLEKDSIALGYIGGFTGKYIEKNLKEKNIKCDFIEINQDSRINVKIKSEKSETEINDKKLKISESEKKELFLKIKSLKKDDILVLAGSVPTSLEEDIYAKLSEIVDEKVKIVVDTTGKYLVNSLKYNPFLIKPNYFELENIFGVKLKDEKDVIVYGKKLLEMGAKNVIVSMAGDGALLINEKDILKAMVPKGTVKNSVGAGDSLIGGFLSAMEEDKELIECFRIGVASGTATAFSDELCKKEEIEKIKKDIIIKKL
ncbi:1-phosphofructokinase [Haliovirga abyssi]|uniref:1-phosphofructokinase n=1 Tax=Haliovirga abyssi TaxID=2996794 RepID=A0AAU9DEA6_9FUSO|nr:1-phosphofructokinase [Haliovirga abyssi]BDU50672.1 tagatose-6-phosphate kinase [Haliovirga abyssi]